MWGFYVCHICRILLFIIILGGKIYVKIVKKLENVIMSCGGDNPFVSIWYIKYSKKRLKVNVKTPLFVCRVRFFGLVGGNRVE